MGNIKDTNATNKYEALFQHASIGIIVVNAQGEITTANNFLLTLFGYEDQNELIGKKIEALIPSRYHGNHTHHRNHYSENPEPRPMGLGRDLFGTKKDGTEISVEISLSNYTTSEGNFC